MFGTISGPVLDSPPVYVVFLGFGSVCCEEWSRFAVDGSGVLMLSWDVHWLHWDMGALESPLA